MGAGHEWVNCGPTVMAAAAAVACLVQSQKEVGKTVPTPCRTAGLKWARARGVESDSLGSNPNCATHIYVIF